MNLHPMLRESYILKITVLAKMGLQQNLKIIFIGIFTGFIIYVGFGASASEAATRYSGNPESITQLTSYFSGTFCLAVKDGIPPDQAAEIATKETMHGLAFSPMAKELLTIPKKQSGL